MAEVKKEQLLDIFLEERMHNVLEQKLSHNSDYESALELQRKELKNLSMLKMLQLFQKLLLGQI